MPSAPVRQTQTDTQPRDLLDPLLKEVILTTGMLHWIVARKSATLTRNSGNGRDGFGATEIQGAGTERVGVLRNAPRSWARYFPPHGVFKRRRAIEFDQDSLLAN
jgi:hypothetical protein